jgi:hypothetical protein
MEDYRKESAEMYSFPDFENTPEEVKQTPKYSIQVAKSIVHKYQKNRTMIGSNWGTFFDELRLFGLGRQPSDLYKTFLSGTNTTTSETVLDDNTSRDVREEARKGWYNVMWEDIVSPLPNLKSQVRGHFSEIDYDIKADNIDLDSGAEEERRMMEVFTNTHPVFGSMINDLKQKARVPTEEPEYIPEGLQELQDLKEEGGFKPPYTMQHEKLILHTENQSGWDRFLKDQVLNDLMDIGYIFAWVDYDDETCMPKWEYVDAKDVIMQYDHETGFQNADYGGRLSKMTISQLKQYRDHIVDSYGKPISEEKFAQIAKAHCNYGNNPTESEWDNFSKQINIGYGYDRFNVPVYKIWWKDTEYIKRIEYTNRRGEKRYYDYQEPVEGEYDVKSGVNEIDFGREFGSNYAVKVEPIGNTKVSGVKSRSNGVSVTANYPGRVHYKAYYKLGKNEAIKKVRIRKLYHCWLIANSDFCIKFGVAPNQPRYQYNEPLAPLVGYRLPEKSLIFRCVPIANMYQIAWYRLQNALAKATQGLYAINTTLLGDNGKKLDALKVLKAVRENQVLFYKMSMNGNVGGTPIPISYIPGNLQEAIAGEASIMQMCMQWIEDQTGFSMIALGQTPSPETGLGVTERSMESTQKSLMPLMTALRYLKEELAKRTSCMWQTAIQNDEKARYEAGKVIGEDGVWILQQAKSRDVQYGIKMLSRPDTEMKAAMLRAIEESGAKGEITPDEKLFVLDALSTGGNIREMRMKLRKMIQKNKVLAQQMEERKIALQGQQIKEQAAINAQVTQQTEMAKLQAKEAEIKIQAIADIAKRDHDSRRKIEEAIAEYWLSMGKVPANPKTPEEQGLGQGAQPVQPPVQQAAQPPVPPM